MEQLTIHLSQLDLDAANPRLPEGIDSSQESLLQYVFRKGNLRELAESFLDNGFFEAERLIVIDSGEEDRYTVVEGNRRLAALKTMHGELGDVSLTDGRPNQEQLDALTEIPCLKVANHAEVDQYLAYRHIGGMKTWSAEARARFTKRMVDQIAEDDPNPFRSVGRQVGSNTQGVRNSYLAISILEYARQEMSLKTDYLQYERFGVWIRCMNSTDVRGYIGAGSPKTFADVQESFSTLNEERLREVVTDLSKRPDGRKPLVSDSRDITAYGRMLDDPSAYQALRKHDDFEVARQIVDRKSLPARLERISNTVSSMLDEVSVLQDQDVVAGLDTHVQKLWGLVRSLRAVIQDLLEED